MVGRRKEDDAVCVYGAVMTVRPVIFWKCSAFLVTMVYPFVRVIAPMRASLSPIGCPFVSSWA